MFVYTAFTFTCISKWSNSQPSTFCSSELIPSNRLFLSELLWSLKVWIPSHSRKPSDAYNGCFRSPIMSNAFKVVYSRQKTLKTQKANSLSSCSEFISWVFSWCIAQVLKLNWCQYFEALVWLRFWNWDAQCFHTRGQGVSKKGTFSIFVFFLF